ncbi:MAG: hypothetical protein ACREA0_03015 [bacterium]
MASIIALKDGTVGLDPADGPSGTILGAPADPRTGRCVGKLLATTFARRTAHNSQASGLVGAEIVDNEKVVDDRDTLFRSSTTSSIVDDGGETLSTTRL